MVADLPPPTEAETTRQRYETLHAADPACKACHTLFDPIGFGFEHLDATGRYRDKEGRFDIDDSGVVTSTSAGDLSFRGATELANALAKLPEVSDCVASYLAAYAFGVSQSNASCLVRSAAEKLRTGVSLVDFYIRDGPLRTLPAAHALNAATSWGSFAPRRARPTSRASPPTARSPHRRRRRWRVWPSW